MESNENVVELRPKQIKITGDIIMGGSFYAAYQKLYGFPVSEKTYYAIKRLEKFLEKTAKEIDKERLNILSSLSEKDELGKVIEENGSAKLSEENKKEFFIKIQELSKKEFIYDWEKLSLDSFKSKEFPEGISLTPGEFSLLSPILDLSE